MFDLTGKVALITGASRGLGLAIAKGYVQSGATVILNGRVSEALDKAAAEIREPGKGDVHIAPFDVSDPAAIKTAITHIETTIGAIDILVNNAGIQHRQPINDFGLADWQRIIDTNLTAPFLMAQAVAPAMVKRKSGKIINVCSITSEVGRANIAPYATSKGGLKMLTKSMAVEWAKDNVQINGIGPGFFITEMNEALVEDKKFNTWVCNRTPAQRWGNPDELAGVAVFLASDASNYVNGQVIYVDGGFLSTM